jgi:flavodoxin
MAAMTKENLMTKKKSCGLFVVSACLFLASCGEVTSASSARAPVSSASSISPVSSGSPASSMGVKYEVIYFSCTGNTKGIADKIAANLACQETQIVPKVPYTAADLNYSDSTCRANQEQNDANARPEIENSIDVASYSTIFLGYPIWWGTLPRIIYTLCDTYDFSEKTIVPFCTSGSSGIETSVSALKVLEPNANILSGRRFASSSSQADVDSWINSLSL